MWMKRAVWMVLGLLALPWLAVAGEVDVVEVGVDAQESGNFTFNVTLRHADEGWEHYADRWDVVSVDGATVYGERVLYHPHVTEQPFTRSLSGVAVPAGVREVIVRGHDKLHELGGMELRVTLPER
jgi:hypothetical protein